MQTITDLQLDQGTVDQLENVYRMVGKRDAGWQFDPSAVPAMIMPPLIDLYIEYLRESNASNEEIKQANELAEQIANYI